MDAVLKGMVLDAPGQEAQLENSMDSLDEQISTFQDKQDSLQNSVCTKVATDLESYLIGVKFEPFSNYDMYKGGNYNQALSSDGSIVDWKVYLLIPTVNLIYVNANQFKCDGDLTGSFPDGSDLQIILGGSTKVHSTVGGTIFDGGITTVTLDDEVCDNTISSVYIFQYQYLAGDDSTIDDFKTNWDFGHDYIVLPLGQTGTYGTQDNIAKLNMAKNMLQFNLTKMSDSVTILEQFI